VPTADRSSSTGARSRLAAGDDRPHGLVRSFQISAVFPHLTVLENVRIALQRKGGHSFDFWKSDRTLTALDARALELIEAVGLGEFVQRTAVELPYGRKRALEIATTLALDPEMMLLDEPTAGMAHEDVERITALIRRVSANRTVLMVEHNLSVVFDVVRSHHGARARGDPRAGRLRERVQESRRRASLPGSGSCLRPVAESRVPTSPAGSAMLSVRGLHAWYGESHVLHGVDFDVRSGEVVTLLGRNGAGKTTTLRAIMGFVPRREGSIVFDGEETGEPVVQPHRAAAASRTAPRSAASSRASTSTRTCCCRRSCGRVGCRSSRSTSSSRTSRSAGRARAPSFWRRAADARHRAHPSHWSAPPAPSTSRRKGLPR
jgi:ABC-type branched-subunit amino acid transport system ATPase component